MLEKEFEEILINHLNLIEEGLSFEGSQVNCEGKRVDILCKDKFGQILVIEVKRIAKRKDIAQLLDYAGYFINDSDVPVRVMLVANRIPQNFRASFDYFGIEYLEIPKSEIPSEYLTNNLRSEPELANDSSIRKPYNANTQTISDYTQSSDFTVGNQTRQNMANRIKQGKMFDQAKLLMKYLLSATDPVPMKKIVNYMKEQGYSSKSYYDLTNALLDNRLISCRAINNIKHYFVVGDEN